MKGQIFQQIAAPFNNFDSVSQIRNKTKSVKENSRDGYINEWRISLKDKMT